MTPKEKARELRDKMYLRIPSVYDPTGIPHYPMANEMALIAVDEILKETPNLVPEETFIDDVCGVDYFINERFKYWQDVKEELIKL